MMVETTHGALSAAAEGVSGDDDDKGRAVRGGSRSASRKRVAVAAGDFDWTWQRDWIDMGGAGRCEAAASMRRSARERDGRTVVGSGGVSERGRAGRGTPVRAVERRSSEVSIRRSLGGRGRRVPPGVMGDGGATSVENGGVDECQLSVSCDGVEVDKCGRGTVDDADGCNVSSPVGEALG